jgi:type I restriction enzyme S subunit
MGENDVLVSTRRPTRGAIVAVPPEFVGHICTVFFSTIRVADRETLLPEYLALFLRTSLGRFQFQAMITETAYPVISDEDVENIIVLVPDKDAQAEIAAAYADAVDEFFNQLNGAYASLASARQLVESTMLGTHAETLVVPRFGLVEEVEDEDDPDEVVEETE